MMKKKDFFFLKCDQQLNISPADTNTVQALAVLRHLCRSQGVENTKLQNPLLHILDTLHKEPAGQYVQAPRSVYHDTQARSSWIWIFFIELRGYFAQADNMASKI